MAQACLLVDSAKQYGLVTGGPVVDVERCVEIICRGAALGVTPNEANVDAAIREMATTPQPQTDERR